MKNEQTCDCIEEYEPSPLLCEACECALHWQWCKRTDVMKAFAGDEYGNSFCVTCALSGPLVPVEK